MKDESIRTLTDMDPDEVDLSTSSDTSYTDLANSQDTFDFDSDNDANPLAIVGGGNAKQNDAEINDLQDRRDNLMAFIFETTDADEQADAETELEEVETRSKTLKQKRYPARELYTSAYFRRKREFAEIVCHDHWMILSAEYALLEPDTEVSWYDVSVSDLDAEEKQIWADIIANRLRSKILLHDYTPIYVLLGKQYIQPLEDRGFFVDLEDHNVDVRFPLADADHIGEQMRVLNNHIKDAEASSRNTHDHRGVHSSGTLSGIRKESSKVPEDSHAMTKSTPEPSVETRDPDQTYDDHPIFKTYVYRAEDNTEYSTVEREDIVNALIPLQNTLVMSLEEALMTVYQGGEERPVDLLTETSDYYIFADYSGTTWDRIRQQVQASEETFTSHEEDDIFEVAVDAHRRMATNETGFGASDDYTLNDIDLFVVGKPYFWKASERVTLEELTYLYRKTQSASGSLDYWGTRLNGYSEESWGELMGKARNTVNKMALTVRNKLGDHTDTPYLFFG